VIGTEVPRPVGAGIAREAETAPQGISDNSYGNQGRARLTILPAATRRTIFDPGPGRHRVTRLLQNLQVREAAVSRHTLTRVVYRCENGTLIRNGDNRWRRSPFPICNPIRAVPEGRF
jgi:hypothetical protein